VFPGGPAAQAVSVARTGHLHDQSGLERLIARSLRCRTFEQLERPLTVVTTDVLAGHVRWFASGELLRPLLAATALPGVFPPVMIEGRYYWDAGSVANVPLQAAIGRGAASLVVLDAGGVCHFDAPPRGIPDALIASVTTAMHQRVLIEAPAVAEKMPLLYLPRPCARNRSLLDLDTSIELVAPTYEVVSAFLRRAEVPRPGHVSGSPHQHPEAVPTPWGSAGAIPGRR
jgi:NTE family protein